MVKTCGQIRKHFLIYIGLFIGIVEIALGMGAEVSGSRNFLLFGPRGSMLHNQCFKIGWLLKICSVPNPSNLLKFGKIHQKSRNFCRNSEVTRKEQENFKKTEFQPNLP
jgi:hypothetical protein